MAEAVMEERPQAPQRFFCHMCNVEIDNISPEYTCPHCTGGFIEELPTSEQNSSNEVELPDDHTYFVQEFNNRLSDEISSLLMSVTGTNLAERDDGSGNRTIGAHQPPSTIQIFDTVLQDFLLLINGGGGGGAGGGGSGGGAGVGGISGVGVGGGTPMFFVGNPADYVFSRDGLDTIVTQLLNQMDSTGPPPLAKDKIAEIPKVAVNDEQVQSKLQCSICWEDFILDETVRQLPCVHIYHENCIIPWLELHGTCPVCRKTLSGDDPEEQRQAAVANVANSLRNVAALYRGDSEATSSNSTESNRTAAAANRRQTRSSTRQQEQQQQQQRSYENDLFRDDDDNIEFD